jgi:GDP-L-fucose synthase
MKEVVGCKGRATLDTIEPDGAPRKLVDVSRLTNIGWSYSANLKESLAATYEWHLKRKSL